MNISYRYLDPSVAIAELTFVKEGKVNIQEAINDQDFHLRPFTEFGISNDRLLEIRADFLNKLEVSEGKIEAMTLSKSRFDSIFTRNALSMFRDLSPIDGFNPDVWSYITIRLLPDLALWRWRANRTDERFLGGAERSCFQRLWLRAFVLGEQLASQLQEDEGINIFERPEALGGNKRLALSIANFIVSNREVQNLGKQIISTDIVKQASKQLRRQISVNVVQSMSDHEIDAFVKKTFEEVFDISIVNHRNV